MKAVKSITLEPEPWARYRELLRLKAHCSASSEMNEFVKRRVAELEGLPLEAPVENYSELKRQHLKLSNEAMALEKVLKREKVFDRLVALATELGVSWQDLGNLREVTPKLLEGWDGLKEHIHKFITLLETVQEKKKIEASLSRIRSEGAQTVKNLTVGKSET